MFLREVMESTVEYVSANDYALDALQRMRDSGGNWACVLDSDDVVGLVYSSDLESHSVSKLRNTDVREHMRPDVLEVAPDMGSDEAERLLRANKKTCLALVEGNRPVGVVTRETLSRTQEMLSV